MTLAAAYLTSEGVVFGADSTTTVPLDVDGQVGIGQLLNHAQKVFEIGPPKQGRIGLCTWGAGDIAGTSHRTLVARLADQIDDEKTTIDQAVEAFNE